jgi:hypothetical protein
MSAPNPVYAQIASTLAQLKAIPPVNRSPNFCILLPELGSWIYYDPGSTATPDDLHCIIPDDGAGRWLVTNQLPYFAAATAAANSAIATHNSANDPHTQYHRRDGVLVASQPNSSTPAYAAKVATGAGSSTGGYQVHTPSGGVAFSLGADGGNRGVITPGPNGLFIGGSPNETLSFFGKTPPVVRPNAIALPGNNTTDMRRAINDLINVGRAIGVLP